MMQALQVSRQKFQERNGTAYDEAESCSSRSHHHPSEDLQSQIARKVRVRLIVALPVLTFIFMIVSGLLLSHLFFHAMSTSRPLDDMVKTITSAWTLVMALLALISCFIAARIITSRMNLITAKLEKLFPPGAAMPAEVTAESEMDALGIMLDEARISLSKFIHDSYILENLAEGVLNLNTRGQVLSFNQKAASLFQLDRQTAIGRNIAEVFPDRGVLTSLQSLFREAIQVGSGAERELSIRKKNGNGNKLDGPEIFWAKSSAITDPMWGLCGVNITFRDPADANSVRSQIQKIERLAAIGSVAAKISHEVRNPLASMRTLIELLQQDFEPGNIKTVYAMEVLKQIDHLNATFEDILSFSRDPIRELELVDINAVVAQAIAFSRYAMPTKPLTIEEAYQDDIPLTMADSERLCHVFFNIIKNAFEATPDNGCLKISTVCEPLDVNSDGRVKVAISDSGCGIEPELGNKIFEPFFTTKPKGTGLGLSMAYQIITAHKGAIEVSARPGEGATFNIFLPVNQHPF